MYYFAVAERAASVSYKEASVNGPFDARRAKLRESRPTATWPSIRDLSVVRRNGIMRGMVRDALISSRNSAHSAAAARHWRAAFSHEPSVLDGRG